MNKIKLIFFLDYILTTNRKFDFIYRIRNTFVKRNNNKQKIENSIYKLKQNIIKTNLPVNTKLEDIYSQPLDAIKEKPYDTICKQINNTDVQKNSSLFKYIENELDLLIAQIDEQIKSLSSASCSASKNKEDHIYCEINDSFINIKKNELKDNIFSSLNTINNIYYEPERKNLCKQNQENLSKRNVNVNNLNSAESDLDKICDFIIDEENCIHETNSYTCFVPMANNVKRYFIQNNIIKKFKTKLSNSKQKYHFNINTKERNSNILDETEIVNDEFIYQNNFQ